MSDSNLLSQQVPGYVDEGASQALHSRASTDEKALYILDRVEIPDVVSACEYNWRTRLASKLWLAAHAGHIPYGQILGLGHPVYDAMCFSATSRFILIHINSGRLGI